MATLQLGKKTITSFGDEVYIIAEIGQNHQGSFDLAREMIMQAKVAGCDCVKFQKSCIEDKFTHSALTRRYDDSHSWGNTYGEHKIFLEFSMQEFRALQRYCNNINIEFTASAMDTTSLHQLGTLNLPFIKIGSGDANNFPMLEEAAKMSDTLVISTGMQTMATVERIVAIMRNANKTNYALLHCVSAYPTYPGDCNLQMISLFKRKFPDIVIGYSGHELGVEISKAAALLGARIIERHITMSKKLKGTDHRCSLEPIELRQLVQGIGALKRIGVMQRETPIERNDILQILRSVGGELEMALRDVQDKSILPCELSCKQKLGKSLVAATTLGTGHILRPEDILIKVSEPNGVPAEELDMAIGSVLLRGVCKDRPIKYTHLVSFDE